MQDVPGGFDDDGDDFGGSLRAGSAGGIIRILAPEYRTDYASILGLVSAVGLIVLAVFIGQSNANFFNVPALLIVLFGTFAVTSISCSAGELKQTGAAMLRTLRRRVYNPSGMARQLLDVAILARKRGVLAISMYENEIRKDPFLARALQLVVDGFTEEDVERLLGQEVATRLENNGRAVAIMRRASEIAPAMGLIGTLVGLVQMLADLDDPGNIGPSMAVALLTTFYGAILGTILMAPLAAKLERSGKDETGVQTLVITAAAGIARQENPRRLEMLLNSELPPSAQVRYFD